MKMSNRMVVKDLLNNSKEDLIVREGRLRRRSYENKALARELENLKGEFQIIIKGYE